jgi:hypothetical protein
MEDEFLSDLSATERGRLHRVLARVAGEPPAGDDSAAS